MAKQNQIRKNELETEVQTSLGKADSALQSVTKTDVGLGNVPNTDFTSAVNANSAKTGVTTQISNVVEDTTPQLGGNLDAQSNQITSLGNVITAEPTTNGNRQILLRGFDFASNGSFGLYKYGDTAGGTYLGLSRTNMNHFSAEGGSLVFQTFGINSTGSDIVFGPNNTKVMTLTSAGADLNSKKITNLANPTAAQDAATKAYVDANAGGGHLMTITAGYDVSSIGQYSGRTTGNIFEAGINCELTTYNQLVQADGSNYTLTAYFGTVNNSNVVQTIESIGTYNVISTQFHQNAYFTFTPKTLSAGTRYFLCVYKSAGGIAHGYTSNSLDANFNGPMHKKSMIFLAGATAPTVSSTFGTEPNYIACGSMVVTPI